MASNAKVASVKASSLPLALAPAPTRSTFAYEQLRQWILHGDLAGGERLDQEQLAETLGISRTPLRQALQQLEADGLVEHRPYQGVVVTALSIADLDDVYATRRAVEGMLAAESSARAQPAAFDDVEQLLEQQAQALQAGDSDELDFVELDRVFHTRLYGLTAFRNALEILDRLLDLSQRYAQVYAREPRGRQQSIDEHRRILEACRLGDAETARRLTEQHIERGRRSLSETIESEQAERREAPSKGAS